MFLSSNRLQASAGGDRSPYGDFWFEPIGMRSATGLRVTGGSAMRLSAVYSCVRVLAETFAVLPFCLYRARPDGGRDPVIDHWLYRLIARRPNGWQTPFEWREMMMGHLCLRGNAFNQLVIGPRGDITDLIPLHPDRVKVQLQDDGNFFYLLTQRDGSQTRLARGEVWHLRGLSSDGIVGLNPMEVAADVLGLGLAAQNYGARFFANDAKPGGWISFEGKFADQNARQTFAESWRQAYSGANRGKTAILEAGMKYNELTLNNSDAQFLESRKFSRSEIASLFRVPPHLIGDLEKATFSNIEQQSLDFVIHTMTPWAERWEASIESALALDDDQLEAEFDFSNLLRGDRAARQAYYHGMVLDGILTRNEARVAEGYNPINGLDQPLRPLNMTTEGQAQAAPDAVATVGPDAAATSGRLAALASAAAARVVRKEVETVLAAHKKPDPAAALVSAYENLARFMVQTLSIEPALAADYCTTRIDAAANPQQDVKDFETSGRLAVERLALGGARMDLALGLSHLASAVLTQKPASVQVAAPQVSVAAPVTHVAAPSVTVQAAPARLVEKIAVRNADGVIEKIIEQDVAT